MEDAPDESIRKISIAAESGEKKAIEWIRKNIGDRSRFDSIVLHYGLKPNDTVIFRSIEAQAMDGNPIAVSAIRSSAEAGHKESMYILGNLYLAGTGVSKSEAEAIACYEKASTADAHYQLAELMDNSEQPTHEALEHYYNAASSGHKEARNRLEKYSQSVPEAAYLLARIYERKDYSKALEMMKKASLLGCEKADEWLEKENKDNKNNKINWNNIQYRSGTFRFYPLFGLRTRLIASGS